MKKLALAVCVLGSAVALSACETSGTGNVETAAPYEMERTATSSPTYTPPAEPVKAERTFREYQAK